MYYVPVYTRTWYNTWFQKEVLNPQTISSLVRESACQKCILKRREKKINRRYYISSSNIYIYITSTNYKKLNIALFNLSIIF